MEVKDSDYRSYRLHVVSAAGSREETTLLCISRCFHPQLYVPLWTSLTRRSAAAHIILLCTRADQRNNSRRINSLQSSNSLAEKHSYNMFLSLLPNYTDSNHTDYTRNKPQYVSVGFKIITRVIKAVISLLICAFASSVSTSVQDG